MMIFKNRFGILKIEDIRKLSLLYKFSIFTLKQYLKKSTLLKKFQKIKNIFKNLKLTRSCTLFSYFAFKMVFY